MGRESVTMGGSGGAAASDGRVQILTLILGGKLCEVENLAKARHPEVFLHIVLGNVAGCEIGHATKGRPGESRGR